MGALPHPHFLAKDQIEGKMLIRCIQPIGIRSPVMALNVGDVVSLGEFAAMDLIGRGFAVAVRKPGPLPIPEHKPAVDKPEERERASETRDTKPGKDFIKK
jgi:hypothetical protein